MSSMLGAETVGFDKRTKDSMPVPDRGCVTIHLDEGAPETDMSRVTFTRQKGVFPEAVLRAVKAQTETLLVFRAVITPRYRSSPSAISSIHVWPRGHCVF